MSRTSAAIGSAIFFVIAPFVVAGLIPWWITGWQVRGSLPFHFLFAVIGAAIAAGGLVLLLDSFIRFAVEGLGTPAPVAPTRHLVIRGGYRFVRNPMYVAVVALILGQALIFASLTLLVYGAAMWLAFHLFVLIYEEPTLRETFGTEYESFTAAVPRWIPRLRPYR